MSSAHAKPQPCNNCRWRKVKCLQDEGAERCHECVKRGDACERGSKHPVANNTPCEECKRAHVACDLPEQGRCARCEYLRLACTRTAAVMGGAPPSAPHDGSLTSKKGYFDVVLN